MSITLYGYKCSSCHTVTYVEWESQSEGTLPCCSDCGDENARIHLVNEGELTVTRVEEY